jgi:CheY-like chemotaxis protein
MNPPQSVEPIRILLVDDDPADVRLTQEALKEHKVFCETAVAGDGIEALAYLRREGPYTSVTRPDIILLDLNMPRKDGREALREIKADPFLRQIPVVVLTTSKSEEDVFRSYDLGANSFVTKPVTFQSLVELMKTLGSYWLEMVELPGEAH